MKTKTLEEVLLEGGFLTKKALGDAKEESKRTGERFARVLIRRRDITPETLSCVLSFRFNMPIVKLGEVLAQEEAKKLVPADLAKRCNVLPLAIEGDALRVVIEDPEDTETLDLLRAETKMRIKPVVAYEGWRGIEQKIKEVY